MRLRDRRKRRVKEQRRRTWRFPLDKPRSRWRHWLWLPPEPYVWRVSGYAHLACSEPHVLGRLDTGAPFVQA